MVPALFPKRVIAACICCLLCHVLFAPGTVRSQDAPDPAGVESFSNPLDSMIAIHRALREVGQQTERSPDRPAVDSST